MNPTPFTPLAAAAGGLLVAIAAMALMWGLGRIAGISGIVHNVVSGDASGRGWRLAFIAGILLSAWMVFHIAGLSFELRQGYSPGLLVAGGLLVGYGTAMGSGCTSGHGVCGLARLSPRSLVATLTFVGTGMLTVYLMRHWPGVTS